MLKLLCEIQLQEKCVWGAAWAPPCSLQPWEAKPFTKAEEELCEEGQASLWFQLLPRSFLKNLRHTEKLLEHKHAVLPSQVKQAEASVLQEFVLNILLMYSEVISTPGMGCAEDAAFTLGCMFLCTVYRRKKRFLPRLYLLKVCFSCL